MVKTNIQTFTGEVEVLEEFYVGSNLVANDVATHVLTVNNPANDAKIKSDFFVGDGGLLSNIATTLQAITDQGNTASNVIIFNSNTNVAGYKNVGFVTTSNVGIQNTAPTHTLSIGDKVLFDDNTDESLGQSVMVVEGRINATRFQGDGGLLSNIATTLESIADQGNTASNVLIFNSNVDIPGYKGVGFVTTSNVGIQNTNPGFNTLSVGSNLFVNIYGSNVLTVHGNAAVSNLLVSEFSVSPAHGLQDVTQTGRHSTETIQLTNTTTGLEVTSNINVAGEVIITDATRGLDVTSNIELGGRLKFDTNVFVDTLRVADIAANIVTYDRSTGELLDSSGTFMNKFAVVSEQPPSDLFANTTTVTNHGGYTLTTSNLATNSNTYNAFDGTANAWVSGDLEGGYIGGSNVFKETNLTQLSNLHPTQFGDWLAIEFPYKTTLRHMKLTPLTAAQFPARANVYATNNDITWSEVKYWGSATDTSLDLNPVTDSNVQTITVNATEQFKKYALVATKAAGNSSNVAIQDWQLFTESFSIDGGKVAMAQQAATGGETVMDQSGPHGRLPNTVPLKKYPEIAFESGKFDKNGTTNVYVQAGYTVESSSQFNTSETYAPWKAFNGVIETRNNASGEWLSGQDTYSGTVNNNAYNATRTIFESTPGEWIGIRMPKKIKLSKASVSSRWDTGDPRSVREYKLWASNNASDWYELATGTSTLSVTSSPNTFDINVSTTDYYSMFRLQILSMNANNGEVGVGEFQLYGYEEDPPAGDTSVDTTFTSIMNTPQTTGANVYVDANLSSDFTNRVVGPTVSNTHTTYVSAGKYWELSGNVESNVTIEANTFLSGDAPHSISMWFNSSNLESNASNSCIFSLNSSDERFDHISAAFSNNYQTVQRLLPLDIAAGDRVGGLEHGVAMNSDGTKVIVGAYQEHADGTNDAGAAYIYTYSNGSWIETTKLVSPDIVADAYFGVSVDMNSDGTKVIVGAFEEDINGDIEVGAAYIFTYSNGSWDTGTKIVASDKNAVDRFGYSVAMSGDGNRVIVGAYLEDEDENGQNTLSTAGSAYIFTYSNGSWDTGTKIVASNRSAGAIFGRSVAINNDGTMVIVGASAGDSSTGTTSATGSAYIFTYSNGSWSETKLLEASDGATSDYFGFRVDMSSDGTKVIVGAYDHHTDGLADAGAAYIFTYSNGSWDTGTKIVAPDKAVGDEFGVSVGMNPDGTKVVVGAWNEDEDENGQNTLSGAGSAYIFTYSNGSWDTGTKIVASNRTAASDLFGRSVAINNDGSKVIVGAYSADTAGTDSGAAWVFTRDTTHYLTTDFKLQSNTWHNLTYAYQGEGGSRVTYLDGRKVAEDQAEDTFGDYPPFAMTDYSQGGYVVSVSSTHLESVYRPFYAFNDVTTDVNQVWHSDTSSYTGTSNQYNGIGRLAANVDLGDWIKLETPHKIKVSYINITARPPDVVAGSLESQAPKDFQVCGSNDNVNWDVLASFTGEAPQDDGSSYYIVNAQRGYKYLAIAVNRTVGSTSLTISNIKYYGHRENDLVRLPDPTNVLKYPHIAMTGPAQRGYVASASGEPNPAYAAYHGFNGLTVSGYGSWHSESSYATSDPRESTTSTLSSWTGGGGGHNGAWLKIQLPHKLVLSSINIRPRTNPTYYHQHPRLFSIVGSNDDTNWYLVHEETTRSYDGATGPPLPDEHTMTGAYASTAWKYFAIVIRTGATDNIYDHVSIGDWELYGTEEASQVPIQIGGGNIDKVANFRVYDKFIDEDQALEIWDAQKDEFGRAKSSMTLHKGRLGLGTEEPEGRLAVLDEPNGLEEFPPRAMTTSETYFEGHGVFKASVSSYQNSDRIGWRAFDKLRHPEPSGWGSEGGYVWNTGVYNGSAQLYSGGPLGEWIQLESPYGITVSYIIIDIYQVGNRGPQGIQIVGSNNGVDWYVLVDNESPTYTGWPIWDSGSARVNVNSTTAYKYHAMIARSKTFGKPGNDSGNNQLLIRHLKFFGTREQGQSVLQDGQMTLTKNLNVPRIGPALDADDTPRRDRLVVEYNTSTNPTFEGAVRDTSGRGLHGVMFGGAYYDAAEKALKFDGSGDYTRVLLPQSVKGNWIHSVSCWVKADVINGEEAVWNIGQLNNFSVGSRQSTLSFNVNSPTLRWYFYANDSNTDLITINPGVWNHIVCVYTGGTSSATTKLLYVNGVNVLFNSISGTAAPLDLQSDDKTGVHLMLGRLPWGTSADLDGAISNFKLYDCALTAQEAKTLYDMGRTGSVANPQPLHIAAPLYAPGTVVQVVHKHAHEYFTIVNNYGYISPMTLSIKPKFNNSKILVQMMINGEGHHDATFRVLRYINQVFTAHMPPDAHQSPANTDGIAPVTYDVDFDSTIGQTNILFMDYPSPYSGWNEGVVEYQLYYKVQNGSTTYRFSLNQTHRDSTGSYGADEHTVSSVVLQEIAQ